MKVVIVEDEMPLAAYLSDLLMQLNPEIIIVQVLQTVQESIAFFNQDTSIDLIFMDIELSDGRSINIFSKASIACPVIFTTAHREFALEAFKMNGIEYLLKPITLESLGTALKKYNNLQRYISSDTLALLKGGNGNIPKKKVLVAKKGIEFCLIKTTQIVCIYSDSFVVFAVDSEGRKYIVETTNLTALEEELDPEIFFRANRKYLVNIDFIKSYKIIERVKIMIELDLPIKESITIGQERSKEFKRWLRAL